VKQRATKSGAKRFSASEIALSPSLTGVIPAGSVTVSPTVVRQGLSTKLSHTQWERDQIVAEALYEIGNRRSTIDVFTGIQISDR